MRCAIGEGTLKSGTRAVGQSEAVAESDLKSPVLFHGFERFWNIQVSVQHCLLHCPSVVGSVGELGVLNTFQEAALADGSIAYLLRL